jgi:hypothetical protein
VSERSKFTAFEVAAAALLARYGTRDPELLEGLGADETELGAARNIAEVGVDEARVSAAAEVAGMVAQRCNPAEGAHVIPHRGCILR